MRRARSSARSRSPCCARGARPASQNGVAARPRPPRRVKVAPRRCCQRFVYAEPSLAWSGLRRPAAPCRPPTSCHPRSCHRRPATRLDLTPTPDSAPAAKRGADAAFGRCGARGRQFLSRASSRCPAPPSGITIALAGAREGQAAMSRDQGRHPPRHLPPSRALREPDRDAHFRDRRAHRRVQRGALSLPPRQRADAADALRRRRPDLVRPPEIVLPWSDTKGNWDCGICELADGTWLVNLTITGFFKRGIRPEGVSWAAQP